MGRYLRGTSLILLFVAWGAIAEPFTGILYPSEERVLSFGASGVVGTVAVKLGDRVKAGDLLLALDDRAESLEVKRRKALMDDRFELDALQTQIETLREQEASAQALYDRSGVVSLDELRALTNERIATEARINQLQAQLDRAAIEYEMAQVEVERLRLRAPVAGIVTQVARDEGEWANLGEPVTELVDTRELSLQISLPTDAAMWLEQQTQVDVRVESGDVLIGDVQFVSPVADASSGLVEARIKVANPDAIAWPGTQGVLDIPTAFSDSL